MPGRWLLGVSGGADSVALLLALHSFRPDVQLVVAHLNHETRGPESDADAEFVVDLCRRLGFPLIARRLSDFLLLSQTNPEARFREARLTLFRQAIAEHHAAGVLLAQHADDRAETILMRLLRDGESTALDGMRRESIVDGVRIVRPLLEVRQSALETFLVLRSQPWRVDSSNASDAFARNRVRKFLANDPAVVAPLLRLGEAASGWRRWVAGHAPTLPESIPLSQLADLPDPLARHSLRKWLRARDVAVDEVAPDLIVRIIQMARDRATPATVNLPGGRVARRRKGIIELDKDLPTKPRK